MGDLEKEIGELKGLLGPLARTAEKISVRVDENRDKITAVETDLSGHKKEVWHAVRQLEGGAKEHAKESQEVRGKVRDLERDVGELKSKAKSAVKAVLRVVELLVAALVGGAVAKMFGG